MNGQHDKGLPEAIRELAAAVRELAAWYPPVHPRTAPGAKYFAHPYRTNLCWRRGCANESEGFISTETDKDPVFYCADHRLGK